MPAQSSSCEQAHRRSRPRGAAGCRIRKGPDDGFLRRRARRKRQIGAEASMSLPRGHAIERGEIAPFAATYAPPDEAIAARLLAEAPRAAEAERRIDARAARLVEAIRARAGGLGGVEDFLREYSLSTKEGLALMVLAEALLRVPDSVTADRLIEDKLSSGDFGAHKVRSHALLVSASAWALGISARVIGGHETPESILHELVSR